MILGIDFGASTTDAVLFDGKKIVKKASSQKTIFSRRALGQFLNQNGFSAKETSVVAVSGGKSAFFKQKIFGFKPRHVNEIDAIGCGAAFLSGLRRCLVVSMGTGTCIVSYGGGKCSHVIGTGVGGGTIIGLSKLLLGKTKIGELDLLAKKGKTSNIDLSIGDVVGKKFSMLDEKATASNFAKLKNFNEADLAAGIQNLVAESVAVLVVSAAKSVGCGKIVFLGKTVQLPFVKKRLRLAAKLFGQDFFFPSNAGFGTAVGAAYFLHKLNKRGI